MTSEHGLDGVSGRSGLHDLGVADLPDVVQQTEADAGDDLHAVLGEEVQQALGDAIDVRGDHHDPLQPEHTERVDQPAGGGWWPAPRPTAFWWPVPERAADEAARRAGVGDHVQLGASTSRVARRTRLGLLSVVAASTQGRPGFLPR